MEAPESLSLWGPQHLREAAKKLYESGSAEALRDVWRLSNPRILIMVEQNWRFGVLAGAVSGSDKTE